MLGALCYSRAQLRLWVKMAFLLQHITLAQLTYKCLRKVIGCQKYLKGLGFVFFTIIDNIRMETTGRNFWALINFSSLVGNTGKAQPKDAGESLQSH